MTLLKRSAPWVGYGWTVCFLLLSAIHALGQSELKANTDTFATEINTPILLDLLANDHNPRGLALQFTLGNPVDASTRLTCGQLTNHSDGSATFIPNTGYEGRCEFGYTVTDGIEVAEGLVTVEVGAGGAVGMARAWVSASAKEIPEVQNSSAIDLNSYHMLWDPEGCDSQCVVNVGGNQECDVECHNATFLEQAQGFFQIENGKPVIVSTDGAGAIWRQLIENIQQEIGKYPKGSRHIEHFDQPFNQFAMDDYIDNPEDWDMYVRRRLDQLGSFADSLDPNGQLSISGNVIKWNDEPVTLMGFSLYGMLSTTRHDLDHYLDMLASNGVNFTREWCIEQWTAQAVGAGLPGVDSMGRPGFETASVPFEGSHPASLDPAPPYTDNEKYRYDRWNESYFQRLAQFVSKAWDRGIVVQISLFDRAGLLNVNGPGRWKHSPYNHVNNQHESLLTIPQGSRYPDGFTGRDGTEIGAINSDFIRKVVETLRPYGNVIFEVMNEPNLEFPLPSEVLPWHEWVASTIHDAYGSGQQDPLATTDPVSVTVPDGGLGSFESNPSGGSGTYTLRWYKGPSEAGPWSFIFPDDPGISGNNQPILTVNTDQAPDPEGWYRVLVRDAADPDDKVWSNPAQLTVDGDAVNVAGPNDALINSGELATFQIEPSGGSGEYIHRWYFRPTETDSWAILQNANPGISGAKSTLLSVDTSTASTTVGFYRAIVRDKNNPSNLKWSRIAQLRFHETPLAVSNPVPQSATIAVGGSQTFAVTASGGSGSYQYQWQFQANGASTWQAVTAARFSGAQTASLSLSGALSQDSGSYRCQVIDTDQNQVNSGIASLTVQATQGAMISIDLGSQNTSQGLTLDVGPPNGDTLPDMAGPSGDIRDCRTNSPGSYRFFFDADSDWPDYLSPNLTITITYLDKTNGLLELHYNATTSNAKVHPLKISLTNTNTWRTFSWQLNDAKFRNGLSHGSEFRIHHTHQNAAQMWLDTVQVHPMQTEGPFPVNPSAPAGSNLTVWVNPPSGGQGGYSYQWFKNGQLLANATLSSYAMSNIGTNDAGAYACRIRDNSGMEILTGATQVTVTTFNVSTLNDQTVIETEPVTWTINASGGTGTYTYQWQHLVQGAWQDILNDTPRVTGAQTDTLVLDPTNIDDVGRYRCRVQNNGQTVFSNEAQLTLLPFNRIEIDSGGQASGDGDLVDRLFHETQPSNGNSLITFETGRWCRKLAEPKYANPAGDDEFLYFKVDDGWALNGNRPEVFIIIQYLDSANHGELELQYDNGASVVTHPVKVVLTHTNQWLEQTWTLTDAYFGGNLLGFGADFRVRRTPGGNGQMYLDGVVVEGPLAPVSVSAVQPIDPSLGVGQNVTFQVTASQGQPPYQYLWFKNGNPIAGSPNAASMTLNNLSLSDAGLYTCQVTDDFGDQALATASELVVLDGAVAFIDLGLVNADSYLELVEPGGSGAHGETGNTLGVTGWGDSPGPRECRRNLDPAGSDDGKPDRKMFFRFRNDWPGTGNTFRITVEYLDTGLPGEIQLTYLSQTGPQPLSGQRINLTGSTEPGGVWKTHAWDIHDADFQGTGMASGTEFYLERLGSGDAARQMLVIDRVTVE